VQVSQLSSLEIIEKANITGTAVGAFNVILLEHAEAIISGAEAAALPVILQISQNAVKYHGTLAPISLATLSCASVSSVQTSVHLDHAEDTELIREALDLGYDSIMYDGSKLDFAENIETSKKMATLAHSYGATIEVELGEIGGKDGVHAPGIRTKPSDAKSFVEETGVDLLAVAVGSSHAMTSRDAELDFHLIAEIHRTISIPLVLHGSSGVSDSDLQSAIRGGMRKINIATHLNHVFSDSVRAILASDPALVDPRKYIGSGRKEVASEITRLLKILNLE
jgi:fructose-bisphosphate aldolase class II